MRIGEVAQRSGIAASAIRFYERKGLLPRPERINGQRAYGPAVLDRLAVIEVSQRAGFSLEEIKVLLSGLGLPSAPSERWRLLAERKLPEIDLLLARVNEMKRLLELGLECGCISLDDCRLVGEARREGEGTVRMSQHSRPQTRPAP